MTKPRLKRKTNLSEMIRDVHQIGTRLWTHQRRDDILSELKQLGYDDAWARLEELFELY